MSSTHFLEPITRSFVDVMNANPDTPPPESITPAIAREVTEFLQASDNALSSPLVSSQEVYTPRGVKLILFTPVTTTAARSKLPLVLYTHGGGFVVGSVNSYARFIRKLVEETNYAIAFVEYTRAPEANWERITGECYAALHYITTAPVADLYNIDNTKVGVVGDSAGGNLAIANAFNTIILQSGGPKLSCAVLLYPVTNISVAPRHKWDTTPSMKENEMGMWLDVPTLRFLYSQYATDDERDGKNFIISPLLGDSSSDIIKQFPATLLLTVQNDPLRDEGEAFAEKLADAGVDVFSVRVKQTVHDFMNQNALKDSSATRGSLDLVVGYLKRHLEG